MDPNKLGWRKLSAWFLTFCLCASATFYSMSLSPGNTQPDMPGNLMNVLIVVTVGFFAANGWERHTEKGKP